MKKKYLLIFALMISALLLTACEKEGAGEKAGKAFDKAISSAKDKIKDVTK